MRFVSALAADPKMWLPILVLAFMALLSALVGYLAWRVMRKVKTLEPAPAEPAGAAAEGGAEEPKWKTAQLRVEVRRALKTLEQLSDDGAGPYSVPWIISAGAVGADTTGLIQGADSERDGTAPSSTVPSAGSVHFCRHGAVFHAGDALLESSGGLRQWRRLLRMMNACRPQRPVDGLVLTLPVSQLIGPDAMAFDRLAGMGAQFGEMIAAAQKITGLRAPVSIILTGAGALRGFSALTQALPEKSLDDSLGWAMPYSLDTAYQPEWASQAVDAIAGNLASCAIQLLMTPNVQHDSDGLLTLPTEVRGLAARLTPLLAAMFQPSAYHEAFLFRGLYLTGKRSDGSSAFVRRLFNEKIFKEHRLVRPVRGLLNARSKRLRAVQAALAGSALISGMGLAYLWFDAPNRADNLHSLLVTVQSDLGARMRAGGRVNADAAEGAAISLLQEMTRLDVTTLTTPLAPNSYFERPDAMIEAAIAAGYNAIIIDEIQKRLASRLTEILSAPSLGGQGDAEIMPQIERLVNDLDEFDRVYRQYIDLPNLRSAVALAAVANYTMGIQLPPGFQENAELYQQAMGHSPVPPLEQAKEMIGRALTTHFTAAFRNRFDEGRLRRRFETIAKLSQGSEVHNPDEAMARLSELKVQLSGLGDDLDSRDYGWINGTGADIGPVFDGLLARLDGMGLVDDDVIDAIRHVGETQIVGARKELFQSLSKDRYAQMQLEGGKAVLSQNLQDLKAKLDALMAHPFMSADIPPQPEMRSGLRPIVWDVQWLKQTHSLLDEYLAFIASDSLKVSSGLAFTVEMAAFDQLSQRVERALSAAAQPAERVQAGIYQMEGELRSLNSAGQQLTGIAEQLRLARLDVQNAKLSETIRNQVDRLLGEIDNAAGGLILTSPPPDFDWWDGALPLAARTYRAPSLPDLSISLDSNHDVLRRASQEFAAPLLKIRDEFGGDMGRRDLAAKWQSISKAIIRYDQKDRDSSLRRLEQFILSDMDKIDPSDCGGIAAGPPTPGGDVFALNLDRLKSNLARRCTALGTDRVRGQYAKVWERFNQSLAGRFPFSRDSGPAVPRADPLDVRRFFWDLAQNPLPARSLLEAAAGPSAADFALSLSASRNALAPMLVDPTLEQPLTYEVDADFRINAGNDSGGNQIIEWGVDFGGDQWLSSREAKRKAVWSAGQPARLFVRFARNGPSIPAPDSQGRYRVDGAMATWDVSDSWALLTLVRSLSPSAADMAALGDRRPHVLALDVQTQRNPQAAQGAEPARDVRVYMRLGLTALLHNAGKPDEKIPVVLPVFPAAAAQLDQGSVVKIAPLR